MNRIQFFKELKFWLYCAMPTDRMQDYVKAFDEFFARGLVSGRTEEELAENIGKPRELANKLTKDDTACITYPVERLAVLAVALLALGLAYVLGAFAGGGLNYALPFLCFGVALPTGAIILCGGRRILLRPQGIKQALPSAIGNVVICLICLAPVLVSIYGGSFATLGIVTKVVFCIILIVFFIQIIQIMRLGITALPALALDGTVLGCMVIYVNLVAEYVGKEGAEMMIPTISNQILALSTELVVLCIVLAGLHWYLVKTALKAAEDKKE